MTFDSDTIYEIWNIMRSHIAAKERLSAANRLVELCDEYGFDHTDFVDLAETDKILEEAVHRFLKDDLEDDEDY